MPKELCVAGQKLYDYSGCIHLHSKFSDGSKSIEEIVDSAKKVGIDYVILTDHDNIEARKKGYEKCYDNLFLFVDFEITPRYNHYLAFGVDDFDGLNELNRKPPQEFINIVNQRGGFGGLSHPFHIGTKRFNIPSYRWLDWNIQNFSLISIWDLMTDWQSKLKSYKDAFYSYYFLEKFLTGPIPENLQMWDKLNCTNKRVVAFGEIDNHAKVHNTILGEYSMFPFEIAFRTIRTHIILGNKLNLDTNSSKKNFYTALKNGCSYISFDLAHDPAGFLFCAIENENLRTMGDEIKLQNKVVLLAKFNSKCRIILIRNGTPILKCFDDFINHEVFEKGIYRVEAYKNGKPWIFSNPIFVL